MEESRRQLTLVDDDLVLARSPQRLIVAVIEYLTGTTE
jgi:hypothetical protein